MRAVHANNGASNGWNDRLLGVSNARRRACFINNKVNARISSEQRPNLRDWWRRILNSYYLLLARCRYDIFQGPHYRLGLLKEFRNCDVLLPVVHVLDKFSCREITR